MSQYVFTGAPIRPSVYLAHLIRPGCGHNPLASPDVNIRGGLHVASGVLAMSEETWPT